MEKRVILFLILCLAIIVGYDYFLKQMGWAPAPSGPERPTPATTPSTPPPAAEPRTPVQPTRGSGQPAGPPHVRDKDDAAAVAEEQIYEVATDLYRAKFTNRGAELRSWQLTRYTIPRPEGLEPVQLMYQGGTLSAPLSLQAADPEISKQLRESLYRVDQDFTTLDASHPVGHLTFMYRVPGSDLRVTKRLTFHYDSYLVDVWVRTEGLTGAMDVGLGTNFGILEWGEGFIGLIGPASRVDDNVEKDMPSTELVRTGNVQWVALQDKYFLSVLMPTGAAAALVRKEGEKLASAWARFTPAGTSAEASLQLYAGPKAFDTLKSLNVGLEETIDFGWFIYGSWEIVRAVAKPLFYVLRFFYEYSHNYGLAIIILTVSIKLLFVPLQYKSYKSMKDMQVIQPKVVELQKKFKDDRERLNRELIRLYRDHKVNPVGGCLPMLLQMPVFVALFNILYMTIDLRQAPFVLWITDLSVQDPYYLLPILMGVSMVVQQKIMPTTMDPTQAKVMLFLPAFMTLLFLTFPAGLVLYWLTNNVLTIGQQVVTDRYIFKRATFSSRTESPSGGSSADGQKASEKKTKDKEPAKTEQANQVETR
jgi:YidC/Oxa1 family membrane protein insertase